MPHAVGGKAYFSCSSTFPLNYALPITQFGEIAHKRTSWKCRIVFYCY